MGWPALGQPQACPFLGALDKYKEKEYFFIGGYGGNLSLRTYPGSYQHFGIACNINYQHYRNDDSNRRYVDSSTGGMMIAIRR